MSAQDSTPNGRTLLTQAAPLITLATTWAIRRAMISGYQSVTGTPAPLLHSRSAPAGKRMLWAATMAAVIAGVEMVIWHVIGDEPEIEEAAITAE